MEDKKLLKEMFEEDEIKFDDYNPDDVPEDDTVDYKDTILRTNEDYYYDDDGEEEPWEPVNPPVNLYDYLKQNSNGAWISFTFDLGDGHAWQENYCHGVSDFRDPELLKQYEVIEERCDYVSLDQGSSYTLNVRKINDKNECLNEDEENIADEPFNQPLGDEE